MVIVRDYLAAIEALPFGSLATLTGEGPVVILAPHPDDETLGCGGLIGLAADAGLSVDVVVLTDGAGSHPNSLLYPPSRLRRLRQDETCCALAALGLAEPRLTFLGIPDTRAPLAGPEFEQAVDAVDAVIRHTGARSLFVTWAQDPHCDHDAAARIADAVAERHPTLRFWHYPIWGLHLPHDQTIAALAPHGVRLDISPVVARKRAAIRCHASQMTELIDDDPEAFRFTDATLAPFLAPYERFMKARP